MRGVVIRNRRVLVDTRNISAVNIDVSRMEESGTLLIQERGSGRSPEPRIGRWKAERVVSYIGRVARV